MNRKINFKEYLTYFLIPRFFPKRFIKSLNHNLRKKIRFDELIIILKYFKDKKQGLMLDVGVQFGESLIPFNYLDWEIYAFEPDPDSKKQSALKRFANNKNVKIINQAVSNSIGKKVPFYASNESTGISSLLSFTNGHKLVAELETTTLTEFIKKNDIPHVNFLKIDVEGFDFFVLEGVPWDLDMPDMILVEFDDYKTNKINISYRDIGDYLMSKGYITYISEWEPLEGYGKSVNWKRVIKYPALLSNPKGWGNFIAFKDESFEKLLKEELKNSPVNFIN